MNLIPRLLRPILLGITCGLAMVVFAAVALVLQMHLYAPLVGHGQSLSRSR